MGPILFTAIYQELGTYVILGILTGSIALRDACIDCHKRCRHFCSQKSFNYPWSKLSLDNTLFSYSVVLFTITYRRFISFQDRILLKETENLNTKSP